MIKGWNRNILLQIYDPTKPVGKRWSSVGDSQIPRLYHSVAFLRPDATVWLLSPSWNTLVSGNFVYDVKDWAVPCIQFCDQLLSALGLHMSSNCLQLKNQHQSYFRLFSSKRWCGCLWQVLISGSETSAERRVQIFTPDYLLTSKPRPVITSAPSVVGYNGTIAIGFSNVTSVDRVIVYRPGGYTHGLHFDERSVLLNCTGTSAGNVSCIAPPNNKVAPAGQYMLFILSSKSNIQFLRLQLQSWASEASLIESCHHMIWSI